MNEPEILTDVTRLTPPRVLIPLTFRKSYSLSAHGRPDVFVQVNVGETHGVDEADVEDLLSRRVCVRPGEPLDAKLDERPMRLKLTAPFTQNLGGILGAGERTILPRHQADRLLKAGLAVPDDGVDTVVPTNRTLERLKARRAKQKREQAMKIIEEAIL